MPDKHIDHIVLFLSCLFEGVDISLFVCGKTEVYPQGWWFWNSKANKHENVSLYTMLREWGWSMSEAKDAVCPIKKFYIQDWGTLYHVIQSMQRG